MYMWPDRSGSCRRANGTPANAASSCCVRGADICTIVLLAAAVRSFCTTALPAVFPTRKNCSMASFQEHRPGSAKISSTLNMLRSVIALALAAATFALRFTPQPASFEEWRSIHGKWYATAAESQARQVRQRCRLSSRRECRHPTDAWGTQAVFEENRAFVLRHNAEALAGSKTYSVHLCLASWPLSPAFCTSPA